MRLSAVAVVAFLMLSVSACGGSDTTNDLPKYSSSPSASATKPTTGTLLDDVPSKAPERPDDTKSKAGAKKFAAYVFDVVFYTLATNDSDALTSIADKDLCQACHDVQEGIDDRPGTIQVSKEQHTVSKAKVTAVHGGYYTILQTMKYPSGKQIDQKTGKTVDTISSNDKIVENINIQWRKDQWVLLNYENAENGES